MSSWIKLHRKLMKWEWYQDSKMVHLFIHLIFSANYEDKNWKGVTIKRGQLLTGLNSLSFNTGISIQSIRTSLKRLEKTGEINRQTNNQYSIITINNYDSYQLLDESDNKQTNKRVTSNQQTGNKRVTTTKKDKNIKNYKEWLSITENGKYKAFIEWFISEDFVNCLKLDDHLTEQKFVKILSKASPEKIKLKISNMENKKDLVKKYKSFYRTLDNWLND